MTKLPIVLHIPHSSRRIPPEWRAQILADDAGLSRELLRMTDTHTERLFNVDGAARAVFPVSRLIVDPERFADDSLEPMAERGMGVIYTRTSDGHVLRNEPCSGDRTTLLNAYYYPHHRKLRALAGKAIAEHGSCLIVDCHSFPSVALPYERQPEGDLRPEICIGTDSYHTPDGLHHEMTGFFESRGYGVATNYPFSGSLVPMEFYRAEPSLYSIMIEIRRDLYMAEESGAELQSLMRLRKHISEAIEFAAEFRH